MIMNHATQFTWPTLSKNKQIVFACVCIRLLSILLQERKICLRVTDKRKKNLSILLEHFKKGGKGRSQWL